MCKHIFAVSIYQDLTGGTIVPVEGPDSPLFALEVCGICSCENFQIYLWWSVAGLTDEVISIMIG